MDADIDVFLTADFTYIMRMNGFDVLLEGLEVFEWRASAVGTPEGRWHALRLLIFELNIYW